MSFLAKAAGFVLTKATEYVGLPGYVGSSKQKNNNSPPLLPTHNVNNIHILGLRPTQQEQQQKEVGLRQLFLPNAKLHSNFGQPGNTTANNIIGREPSSSTSSSDDTEEHFHSMDSKKDGITNSSTPQQITEVSTMAQQQQVHQINEDNEDKEPESPNPCAPVNKDILSSTLNKNNNKDQTQLIQEKESDSEQSGSNNTSDESQETTPTVATGTANGHQINKEEGDQHKSIQQQISNNNSQNNQHSNNDRILENNDSPPVNNYNLEISEEQREFFQYTAQFSNAYPFLVQYYKRKLKELNQKNDEINQYRQQKYQQQHQLQHNQYYEQYYGNITRQQNYYNNEYAYPNQYQQQQQDQLYVNQYNFPHNQQQQYNYTYNGNNTFVHNAHSTESSQQQLIHQRRNGVHMMHGNNYNHQKQHKQQQPQNQKKRYKDTYNNNNNNPFRHNDPVENYHQQQQLLHRQPNGVQMVHGKNNQQQQQQQYPCFNNTSKTNGNNNQTEEERQRDHMENIFKNAKRIQEPKQQPPQNIHIITRSYHQERSLEYFQQRLQFQTPSQKAIAEKNFKNKVASAMKKLLPSPNSPFDQAKVADARVAANYNYGKVDNNYGGEANNGGNTENNDFVQNLEALEKGNAHLAEERYIKYGVVLPPKELCQVYRQDLKSKQKRLQRQIFSEELPSDQARILNTKDSSAFTPPTSDNSMAHLPSSYDTFLGANAKAAEAREANFVEHLKTMLPDGFFAEGNAIDKLLVDQVVSLGEGMTGKVYLGSLEDEPELGYLAIKLLRIGFSEKASDRIDRESCLRELTVLSGGGIEPHPNICRARRAFFQAKTGTVIVAMELMACSLGQLLKKCGRMPEEYAIHIFYEILKGLVHLHETHGFWHGDLKAPNILVGIDGQIKITDFGLSMPVGKKSTGAGGTLTYMAPEVAAETKDVDEKSDTWSLGITFIEVLDGSLEKMIKRMLSEVCLQEDNQIMAKREIAALQSSPTCDAPVSRCLRNLLYDMLIVDPDRRPSISLITDGFRNCINHGILTAKTQADFAAFIQPYISHKD